MSKGRLLIVVLALLLGACSGPANTTIENDKALATPTNPVRSPSGQYILHVQEVTKDNMPHWRFAIEGAGGETLFTAAEAYRTRDTNFFLWDQQDRVWVYSGDVGTSFWERVTDTNWQRHSRTDNREIIVPPLLMQLRPNHFK